MNRIAVINRLIIQNNYTSYLEIGVNEKSKCFNLIDCANKTSVDPCNIDNYDHNVTSDEFFVINKQTYDIIFIDGLHHAEQVEKDILNSLDVLNSNGSIVVHDTNPITEFHQLESQDNTLKTPARRCWNGTVWKAIFKLRKTRDDILIRTYAFDCGVTIISRGRSDLLSLENPYYSYNIFDQNRKEILNIIDNNE